MPRPSRTATRSHSHSRDDAETETGAGARAETGVSEALKRKRERDKDNQRKKRMREREYTARLEQKVAELEQRLTDSANAPSPSTPLLPEMHRSATDGLVSPITSSGRASSACITIRYDSDLACYDRADDHAREPERFAFAHAHAHASLPPLAPSPSDMGHSAASFFDPETIASPASLASHGSAATASTDVVVSTTLLTRLLSRPEWMRLPYNTIEPCPSPGSMKRGDRFAPILAELRSDPTLLAACDEVPKVLDLLFGGSSNQLANLIEPETSLEPTLPPERFAVGWLIYIYVRVSRTKRAAHRRFPY